MTDKQSVGNLFLAKISLRIILIACIAFLLFLIGMLYLNYQGIRQSYLKSVETAFQERIIVLDNKMLDTATYVINMHAVAERYLSTDYDPNDLSEFSEILDTHFRFHPESELLYMYESPVLHGMPLDSTVYLRGPADSNRMENARVLLASCAVLNLQKAASVSYENVVLSYIYTEHPRYSNIYPYVEIEMRLANSGAKVYDIFPKSYEYARNQYDQFGTKEYFWTKPYFDFTGKGMMVSCAKPIMYKGKVNGIAGADVTLAFLNDYLQSLENIKGKMYLISDHGQIISGSDIVYTNEEEVLDADEFFAATPDHMLSASLTNAPWKLYYEFSDDEINNRLYSTSLFSIAIIACFILLSAIGILQLRKHVLLPGARAERELQDLNSTLERRIDERTSELNKRKILLNTILESSDNGFLVINNEGRVELSNRKFAEVCKIPQDLIDEADDRKMIDNMLSRLTDPEQFLTKVNELYNSFDESFDILHLKDGTIIERFSTPLVLKETDLQGRIWVFRDVTERSQMFDLMMQSEKMLSVGGLAAGMAHEINNPLAAMMQTAANIKNRLSFNRVSQKTEAMAEEMGIKIDALKSFMEERDIFKMLDSMNDAGVRIAQIVENMLSFARKSSNEFAPVSINHLLKATVELAATDFDLKKKYDFKLISIEYELSDQLPEILCDSGQIQQVLLNLLRNSAQAMQKAGVKDPKITLTTNQEDEYVVIHVQDNGPGMTEETRRRIFEPFFTTKEVGIGTGLGLSISYFIITENHNGKLQVQSTLGQGADFILELPVTDTSAK